MLGTLQTSADPFHVVVEDMGKRKCLEEQSMPQFAGGRGHVNEMDCYSLYCAPQSYRVKESLTKSN